MKHDRGAMRPRPLDLVEGGGLRHHDGRRNGEPASVVGHGLRVIAGRHGDDAAVPFAGRQRLKLHIGAAVLEGVGDLQILELDPDLGARQLRQLRRVEQGGSHHIALEQRACLADVVDRHGHCRLLLWSTQNSCSIA
jgi:hypothetical protein